jgi:Rrf2 family protein
MQISYKAIYAVKATIYVASYKNNKLCTITEIAENEKVPREFLAKILKELTQRGILRSYRGVQGGYKLAKSPSEISFLDIIEAVQDKFNRIKHPSPAEEHKVYQGASFDFWQELYGSVETKLAAKKLDSLNFGKFYPHAK